MLYGSWSSFIADDTKQNEGLQDIAIVLFSMYDS